MNSPEKETLTSICVPLDLPSFPFKLKMEKGIPYLFDDIRKKYLVLTPEEWVRQHFINYLITEKKYPKSLISTEQGLKVNERSKRSDILVYDKLGKVFLLIECKAASVKLSQSVFDQVAVYNSTIKAPYMAITNGLQHYCCSMNHEENSYAFLVDFPTL